VGDIKDDECGRSEYKGKNFVDQAGILFLKEQEECGWSYACTWEELPLQIDPNSQGTVILHCVDRVQLGDEKNLPCSGPTIG
jgi:hypothetical protein